MFLAACRATAAFGKTFRRYEILRVLFSTVLFKVQGKSLAASRQAAAGVIILSSGSRAERSSNKPINCALCIHQMTFPPLYI